ncbi:MAG TPA: hypothetical protein VGI23_27405 [Steroidobacteraceae bacterium]
MAKRMGARTIEVKASHLSMISHPDVITRLILEERDTKPDAQSRARRVVMSMLSMCARASSGASTGVLSAFTACERPH